MKRLIIGDLHLGVNENDDKFLTYQKECLEWIIEESKNYQAVDFLGDIFDNRSSLSHKSINLANWFFNALKGKVGVLIVGNHDCHYKNTNKLNSLNLLLNKYNVVSDDCVEVDNIIYVPWINKENQEKIVKQIEKSKAKVCLGHFDLVGFLMQKGILSKHNSLDKEILDKFNVVISGHYHSYSSKDNVVYVGTPYELTFADLNVKKYIGLLENSNLSLIENVNTFHHEISIDSEENLPEPKNYLDKKVKIVINCERTIDIEKWLLELQTICNLKVNDNFTLLKNIGEGVTEIKSTNILSIWNEYISNEQVANKEDINILFEEEYKKIVLGEN